MMENIFIKKIKERLEAEPDLIDQLPEDVKTAVQNYSVAETENTTVPVPQSLTSRQLRLQWVAAGHDLATIQTAINQLPEPHKTQAQINWEYAGNFERNNELLCAVADALGISQEELDNIFRNGSRL